MYPMRNPIRRYDWGSTEAIPELLGVTPDGGPQAELWIGAYETESSSVRVGSRWEQLADVLRERDQPRLPFLTKVMAIGAPLSLQIHPDSGPDAKTEMLYAWQSCRALCGFRDVAQVRALLADLSTSRDDRVRSVADGLQPSTTSQPALRDGLAWLLRGVDHGRIDAVRAELRRLPRWTGTSRAMDDLAARHGADPAVLSPLLLATVELAPGEALVCRPGQPHTYLSGVGVEVQTSSDAVVRAGLTSKPTDVDAFLADLVTDPGPGRVEWTMVGAERVYAPSGTDLALGVLADLADEPCSLAPDPVGPQILLCLEGEYTVTADGMELALRHGESAFVPGPSADVAVRGKGCLCRVSAGRAG
ncbi:MAG TPA: mannose-6-phosphate isomerase, class I [Nocardioidaceae bacterium]|nr:mannose-6-phosphate isomerase, class I [Nocardioidaceae bacterium]